MAHGRRLHPDLAGQEFLHQTLLLRLEGLGLPAKQVGFSIKESQNVIDFPLFLHGRAA